MHPGRLLCTLAGMSPPDPELLPGTALQAAPRVDLLFSAWPWHGSSSARKVPLLPASPPQGTAAAAAAPQHLGETLTDCGRSRSHQKMLQQFVCVIKNAVKLEKEKERTAPLPTAMNPRAPLTLCSVALQQSLPPPPSACH